MDCGCYAINAVRYYSGSEPVEITSASCIPSSKAWGIQDPSESKQVDSTTVAEMKLESGAVAKIECSLDGPIFANPTPYAKVLFLFICLKRTKSN